MTSLPLPKKTWYERAKEVSVFHKSKLKETNGKWIIADTAKLLNRAESSVAEDLMIIEWCKTHPKIEGFKTLAQAKEFVRSKKKELRLL